MIKLSFQSRRISLDDSLLGAAPSTGSYVKPGLHIVATIVSTVTNMFPTLSQAILIHANTLIATSQASPAL